MKKLFKYFLAILFLTTSNAFAFDLGGALKSPEKEITKNVNEKVDKLIGGLEDRLTKEIKEYKDKIDAEEKKIRAIIKETEDSINKIREIKNKAAGYIRNAKMILAILSSSILVLIFVMWRIWRNIVGFKRALHNVTHYDEINKRLKQVEAELAKLKNSN